MTEKIGKCHDCTAPQTEVDMLSRHILELQADKGRLIDENKDLNETIDKLREQFALRYNLEDRIKELEAQIEKMKCCQNCRKFNNLSYDCTCAEVCNEWELRR